jgi:hypothetical protein
MAVRPAVILRLDQQADKTSAYRFFARFACFDQLALREAQLSKRSAFSGLSPLKLPGDASPGRETQSISASFGHFFAVLPKLIFANVDVRAPGDSVTSGLNRYVPKKRRVS